MAQKIKRGDTELFLSAIPFEVKEVEGQDRVLRFIGSDETPDRDNDIIEVAGWELVNYRKNPVFLWAHDYRFPPIGRAVKVSKEEGGLMFDIEFPAEGVFPFADLIYNLYKGKFLRATSVGFIPKKSKPRDDDLVDESLPEWRRGTRYQKQELLELSAVPVPSNPNALEVARSKGYVTDDQAEALADFMNGKLGCPTKACKALEGVWKAEAETDAPMVEVVFTTEEVRNWVCPHCQQKIGEKELYFDGVRWFHRPCQEAGPIKLPKDRDDPREFNLKIVTTEKRLVVMDLQGRELGDVVIAEEIWEQFFGQKAGAVLSRKNKDRLTQAQALIQEVLDSAESAEEGDGDKGAPEPDTKAPDGAPQADKINLEGINTGQVNEIDLDAIEAPKAAGGHELNIEPGTLKALLKEVVKEELDKARGKVS